MSGTPVSVPASAPTAARRGGEDVTLVSLHTSPLAQAGQGDAGGMNVYVRNLALALAAQGRRVWILTRQDGPEQGPRTLAPGRLEPPTGIAATQNTATGALTTATVVPVPAGPATPVDKDELHRWVGDFAAAAPRALREAGALAPPAVVHSHYWLSGVAGMALARRWRAPLVHSMHTMAAVKNTRDRRAGEPAERQDAERRITAGAQLLIANTDTERDELIGHYAADPRRIAVIRPGVDLSVFTPDGPAIWPGREAPVKALFAGRIQPHKGPQVVIAALGNLAGMPVALHLTGAPSGVAELDLPDVLRRAGVDAACTVSGPMPPAQLAAAYRAADVVVMPSFSESFGLVALEAQACGTPVLAHRVGGLVHAVEHGVTGRLVESLDPVDWTAALGQIVADPDSWRRLGAAAALRAQTFSWTRTAAEMCAAYATLVG